MTTPDRPAVRLPSGQVLAMPEPPQFAEFALPGNFRAYPDAGMLTFYDGATKTGATYYTAYGTWALQQPVSREQFWLHCELLAKTTACKEIAEAIAADVAAGLATPDGQVH